MITQNNLALAYGALNKPVDIMKSVQKLREAPALFGFKDSRDWQARVFTTLYPVIHSMYIRNGLFSRAEKIMHDTERSLREFAKEVSAFHRQLLGYNLAYLHFGRREFGPCLRQLQPLLRTGEKGIRSDLFLNARLIELLTYFEQKDEEAFSYGAINMNRFLARNAPGERSIKLLLNFLKQQLRTAGRPRKDWDALRKKIKKQGIFYVCQI